MLSANLKPLDTRDLAEKIDELMSNPNAVSTLQLLAGLLKTRADAEANAQLRTLWMDFAMCAISVRDLIGGYAWINSQAARRQGPQTGAMTSAPSRPPWREPLPIPPDIIV